MWVKLRFQNTIKFNDFWWALTELSVFKRANVCKCALRTNSIQLNGVKFYRTIDQAFEFTEIFWYFWNQAWKPTNRLKFQLSVYHFLTVIWWHEVIVRVLCFWDSKTTTAILKMNFSAFFQNFPWTFFHLAIGNAMQF